ncbi:hypothetical protein ACP4OV_022707 [Aristida adscensionis]
MAMVDKWTGFGSALASFIFLWSMVQNHVPVAFLYRLTTWANKLASFFNPYLQITISEYGAERFRRSDFFFAVEAYLSDACARRARKLTAELGKDSKKLQVSVDDHEEVTDTFAGATIWWHASIKRAQSQVISFYPGEDERRFYQVIFHKRHRNLIVDSYLPYVLEEGRAVTVRNRQRRLFTNNPSSNWNSYRGKTWSHVPFEHPATFDTLAMDPLEKEAIIDDLSAFKEAMDYYTKVGKAWKRGYLLYGPPGTGKSTMIAAMANFLDYDVYDLELTAVKNNTELRKLFIETTGKSIIVIEDIDCSVDLTGKRKDKKVEKKPDDQGEDKPKLPLDPNKDDGTKVTLSGLLNFIDGLWSACGGERIIIFTTNYKEMLDPALIRRGRMDKHIEMSYCRFEDFKVLANNYLDITDHELFEQIHQLLEETDMSPADVAENLMPMSKKKKRDANVCLASLVDAIKKAKEDAAVAKALAEAKAKEEAEASEKAAEVKKGKEKEEADGKKVGGEDEGKDKTSADKTSASAEVKVV